MTRPPLVVNAGDPAQVTFARRQEDDQADAERALWRQQLGTYEGREFLWTCLLAKLPGRQDIHGEAPEVYRQLGRRSVWLEVYLAIEQHPELLLQLQREGLARERKAIARIAAQRESERQQETPS